MNNFLKFLDTTKDPLATGQVLTIDKEIIKFFNSLFGGNGWGNLIFIFISMILCVILVGIIGYQREVQGHNAGFRTHILVGLGSCLIMILSLYSIGYSADKFETMRLAASIPPGIGFIGAGVIIKTRTSIKGLTTAATLWMSMAIGLACGSGNLVIAVLGSIFAYLCLFVFYRFEIHAGKKVSKLNIYLPLESKITFDQILDVLTVYSYNIKCYYCRKVSYEESEALMFTVEFNNCYKEPLEMMCRDLSIKLNPLKCSFEVPEKHQKTSE